MSHPSTLDLDRYSSLSKSHTRRSATATQAKTRSLSRDQARTRSLTLDQTRTESLSRDQTRSGAVTCDFCPSGKERAVKSCLVCQASFCEDHVQTHYEYPALMKHKLVKATGEMREKLCAQHDKLLEAYCRTDDTSVCVLCMMDEHKHHDTVPAGTERTEKQHSAQTALDENERIFTELLRSFERKFVEVREMIQSHEKTTVSRAEILLDRLEEEITLMRKNGSNIDCGFRLHLPSWQALSGPSGYEDLNNIVVAPNYSFEATKRAIGALKLEVEETSKVETSKISAADNLQLTLDSNTVHPNLQLSDGNRTATMVQDPKRYSSHLDRFDQWQQVHTSFTEAVYPAFSVVLEEEEERRRGIPGYRRSSEMSLWMMLPVSLPALTITGIWVVLYNQSCEEVLYVQSGPTLCCTLDNVPLIRSGRTKCGTLPPESSFFSLICSIGSFMAKRPMSSVTELWGHGWRHVSTPPPMMVIVLLRYAHVIEKHQNCLLNTASLSTGWICAAGLIIVGNFQVDSAKALHYVGAGMAFPTSMLFVLLQSALTYRLAKTQREYGVAHLRLAMSLLASASLVLSILLKRQA
ncbi:hypothetical protein NHX12_022478 [Muraenolepis orangiensis]|uniref:B box-type domain-containing protein n=1 Tax=Muraenolepis orangiensis TaxID=630683 RepID=A0A9Q0ENP0_9TELE|nr:hypothetical protein NHX12_022478 [Muraenolepis orangiensis]